MFLHLYCFVCVRLELLVILVSLEPLAVQRHFQDISSLFLSDLRVRAEDSQLPFRHLVEYKFLQNITQFDDIQL